MKEKRIALIIIILVLLMLISLSYIAYLKGYIKNPIRNTPTTSLNLQPSISPPTTDPSTDWKSFKTPKTDYTKAFTLYYPSTWQLETQPSIKLSKGTPYFDIKQGAGSVGACLFNEDTNDPEAPKFASFFPSYKEIVKSNQIIWRLAEVENPESSYDTYFLCEKKPGETFYSQYTSIGYVPLSIPQSDATTVNEVLEIFKKIEIIQ